MATFVPLLFGHAVLEDRSRGRRPPAPAADTTDLRVRVPVELKRGVEAAAARAGVPADLWLVDTLGRSVGSARA
ncbi:MAG: hypothetical protein ABR583_12415 [Gaiellaceae bacterium]